MGVYKLSASGGFNSNRTAYKSMLAGNSTYVPFVNTPPVTSGLTHWYDGTDAATMTVSSGNISQWNNKSPASGGPNISNGTGSQQPGLESNVRNGYSAVRFVQANGDNLKATVQPTTGSSAFSVVVAGQTTVTDTAVGQNSVSWGDFNAVGAGVSIAMRPISNGNGKLAGGYAGSYDTEYANSANSYSGAWFCQVFTANSSSLTQVVNNSDSSTRTSGVPNVVNNSALFIGQLGAPWFNTGGWNGYIGDVLIYNRVLTTQERSDISSWLMQKWAIS